MNILLTGASGYIGKRLLLQLLEDNHDVYCVIRDKRRFDVSSADTYEKNIHLVECDLLDDDASQVLPTEIDIAYYLVHAMSTSSKEFNELERVMAENFQQYLDNSSVQQCIYLSGIVNQEHLSKHLESRYETEKILRKSKVPLTVLRAAIIIGSGSASFEIIRDLVEKLPVMVAPKWLNTRCQPIAIRDVLRYLTGVMLNRETFGEAYDIGGPDVLTYKEMLLGYADVRNLKRFIITLPILTPRLSSYWLYFVTSTSYSLAVSLVNSMEVEVVCREDRIMDIVSTEQIGYKKAVALALGKIKQHEVVSSWKDAVSSGEIEAGYTDYIQVPDKGTFSDKRVFCFPAEKKEKVMENIWRIGGDRGWYYGNMLWKIRGFLDKMVGGVGLRRGRRSPSELRQGDALDFWRVLVADKEKQRLLLFAEMKLPGEAWLEFHIQDDSEGQACMKQTATFRPKGVGGRLYWYTVSPFHFLVFHYMGKKIVSYEDPH